MDGLGNADPELRLWDARVVWMHSGMDVSRMWDGYTRHMDEPVM